MRGTRVFGAQVCMCVCVLLGGAELFDFIFVSPQISCDIYDFFFQPCTHGDTARQSLFFFVALGP